MSHSPSLSRTASHSLPNVILCIALCIAHSRSVELRHTLSHSVAFQLCGHMITGLCTCSCVIYHRAACRVRGWFCHRRVTVLYWTPCFFIPGQEFPHRSFCALCMFTVVCTGLLVYSYLLLFRVRALVWNSVPVVPTLLVCLSCYGNWMSFCLKVYSL